MYTRAWVFFHLLLYGPSFFGCDIAYDVEAPAPGPRWPLTKLTSMGCYGLNNIVGGLVSVFLFNDVMHHSGLEGSKMFESVGSAIRVSKLGRG